MNRNKKVSTHTLGHAPTAPLEEVDALSKQSVYPDDFSLCASGQVGFVVAIRLLLCNHLDLQLFPSRLPYTTSMLLLLAQTDYYQPVTVSVFQISGDVQSFVFRMMA